MTSNVISPTADGIIAALLAPFFMSLGFFIWDARWTSSGGSAFALNLYKCNTASVVFLIVAGVRGFSISTYDASEVFTVANVGFLVLSSTLGILVGDILWLEALRLLGAKHVIVVDSLKPFIAAILGRVGLGEVLNPPTWGGMVLTVMGVFTIAWEEQRIILNNAQGIETCNKQITETEINPSDIENDESNGNDLRDSTTNDNQADEAELEIEDNFFGNENYEIDHTNSSSAKNDSHKSPTCCVKQSTKSNPELDASKFALQQKQYRRGYFCAIFNVLADSLGSLLTKKYGVGMTTWSINLIRFGFAGVSLFAISIGIRLRQSSKTKRETVAISKRIDGENNDCDMTIHENVLGDTIRSTNEEEVQRQPVDVPLWYELPTLTKKGWLQITAGVGLVTFLCPALGNYALFQIALGLAVALSSIGPLYGLLMDWPFKGRRPTLFGCVGVLLTISGVVILCLWGTN